MSNNILPEVRIWQCGIRGEGVRNAAKREKQESILKHTDKFSFVGGEYEKHNKNKVFLPA